MHFINRQIKQKLPPEQRAECPPFPKKNWGKSNLDPGFIEQRRSSLECYYSHLFSCSWIESDETFVQFLSTAVDKFVSASLKENTKNGTVHPFPMNCRLPFTSSANDTNQPSLHKTPIKFTVTREESIGLFLKYDHNNEKRIDCKDLPSLYTDLGGEGVEKQEIEQLQGLLDRHSSGKIDLDDFYSWFNSTIEPS